MNTDLPSPPRRSGWLAKTVVAVAFIIACLLGFALIQHFRSLHAFDETLRTPLPPFPARSTSSPNGAPQPR